MNLKLTNIGLTVVTPKSLLVPTLQVVAVGTRKTHHQELVKGRHLVEVRVVVAMVVIKKEERNYGALNVENPASSSVVILVNILILVMLTARLQYFHLKY